MYGEVTMCQISVVFRLHAALRCSLYSHQLVARVFLNTAYLIHYYYFCCLPLISMCFY